jgi:hypothetical protein
MDIYCMFLIFCILLQAIEIGDIDQMVRLAKEFDGFIVRCIQDQNASHIVQKCIEHIPQQHMHFIFKNGAPLALPQKAAPTDNIPKSTARHRFSPKPYFSIDFPHFLLFWSRFSPKC